MSIGAVTNDWGTGTPMVGGLAVTRLQDVAGWWVVVSYGIWICHIQQTGRHGADRLCFMGARLSWISVLTLRGFGERRGRDVVGSKRRGKKGTFTLSDWDCMVVLLVLCIGTYTHIYTNTDMHLFLRERLVRSIHFPPQILQLGQNILWYTTLWNNHCTIHPMFLSIHILKCFPFDTIVSKVTDRTPSCRFDEWRCR